MPVEYIECEQNSPEWRSARAGVPTASMFSSVMASGRDGGESKTRRSYMLQLAGEIITGEPEETYYNADMARGHDMEGEARGAYALMTNVTPELVGFAVNGRVGASPDSLILGDGLLEIKTKKPSRLVDVILRGGLPPEHKAQVQGQLWVCEREWCDLVCYWPGMPLYVHREVRDSDYIKSLSEAVDNFVGELDEMVAKVRAYT